MRARKTFRRSVIVLALAAPFAAAARLGSRICARRAGACRASTRGCAAWRCRACRRARPGCAKAPDRAQRSARWPSRATAMPRRTRRMPRHPERGLIPVKRAQAMCWYRPTMLRRFRSSLRLRLQLGLLALLALLFQQTALAAYVCPMWVAMPTAGVMSSPMASMPGCAGERVGAVGMRLMCTQHCAQQAPAPQDARVPPPPALALPPQPPVLAAALPVPAARPAARASVLHDVSPPAPSCVLLI